MKIKSKIFLNLFLISIFSVAVVSGSIYYFGRQIIIDNIASYNYILAQNDIDAVDRFVDRRLERWQSYVSSNTDLWNALHQSNDKFAKMDGREVFIKTEDDAWKKEDKNTITPFMKTILENPISDGLRLRTAFYEKQSGYKIFPEFFVTNKYGALIATTNKTTDYLQSDEDWWQKAEDEGVWVGDLSFDESSGVNGLEFCIRIDDNEGNFVGVAKIIYNIKDISNIIDSVIKPLASGVEITSLGFTRKTVNVSLLTKDRKLIYSTKSGFGNLKDYPFSSILNTMIDSRKPYLVATVDGTEKLFSHGDSLGYSDFKGFGWSLMVEKDTQEVLAPLGVLLNWLFVSILVVFGLVVILALWLSSSFNKPIKKLMQKVEQVENGDLDIKLESLSRDEIGQLAKSFGDMVVAVKESRREINKKVEEQTAEIRQKSSDLIDKQKAILNILEDVKTEKENVERERDKVNAILHGIGDGVFVVDKDYKITVFNSVAENISGFSVKEVIGKRYNSVLKFVFEKDEKVQDEFVRSAMESGRVKQMSNHTVMVRKDGQHMPVADSAAPLKDEKGKVVGCVVVFRDVTKEREIDKMKSEFVSVASHQLSTPLTGIKWFTELLLKNKLSPTAKDYVKQIAVSNERMVHLVDDLLNVSRIETGRKFDILPVEVDVVSILNQVIDAQNVLAPLKKLKIELEKSSPQKLILLVDGEKMRQVFQNLVNNAFKYSKEGGHVEVGIKEDKNAVVFYVKDRGIGIPENQQHRLFEKFFRATNALTAHTDGTGLGLYIIKAIVEGHKGKVWFESKENVGTTFFVSLPILSKK